MDRFTVGPPERRRASRRVPAPADPLARVRLRTGPELTVVDVSNTGALVEGTARLLPGTRVDMHVIAKQGRVLARSRVVRAFVSILRGDSIRYRSAVSFDPAIDASAAGYRLPAAASPAPALQGTPYPEAAIDSVSIR